MKKGVNVRYFLREGISNIRLNRMMSTAAVMMLAACFLVIGSFALIVMNLNETIDRIGRQNEIIVYLQDYVDDETAEQFGFTLMEIDNVDSVHFISRDEGLKAFSDNLDSDELYQTYVNDNPLRNSYEVVVTDLERIGETVDTLSQMPQVAKARASMETVANFLRFRNVATVVGVTLVVVLALLAAVIISNTIRLTTHVRREEIAIMKMVGATNRFIRGSFLVEGVIIGFLASVFAYLLLTVLYQLVIVPEMAGFSLVTLISFSRFWDVFLACYLGAGILYGLGISFLTIKKYLEV